MGHFRYVVMALCVVAAMVDMMTRTNFGLAIVSMVNGTADESADNSTTNTDICPLPKSPPGGTSGNHTKPSHAKYAIYDWDEKTQGILLGAFYFSYQFLQIPAGRLAEIFGGKWIIAGGLLGSGLVNLITPIASRYVILLAMLRIGLGVIQGGIMAACMAMVLQWMPPRERSTGYGLISAGACIGIIVTNPLTGYLADSDYFGGWPSAFYVAGIIGLISFALFAPLVKSKPASHPFVSKEELLYITNEKTEGDKENSEVVKKKRTLPVPWRRMLTSPPVLATMFAKWCGALFVVKVPDYFSNVLHVPMSDNGFYGSLFSIATVSTVCISGYLSELVIESKILSKTNTRKCFGGLSIFGSGIFFAATTWAGCNVTLAVTFQTLSCVCAGFSAGGDGPIPMELTKNFPATLYAVMNLVTTSPQFYDAYVAGIILQSSSDMLFNWRLMFYLSGALNCLGGVVFVLFASAEVQDWDEPEEDEECIIDGAVDVICD